MSTALPFNFQTMFSSIIPTPIKRWAVSKGLVKKCLNIFSVKFEDATKVVIDAAKETHFIGVDRMSCYWIHKEV